MLGRPFEDDERSALRLLADQSELRSRLVLGLNNRARSLVSPRDASATAVKWGLILARQAVRLDSSGGTVRPTLLNTLGVSLYRARQYAEARDALTRSLAGNQGVDAYDLFFLAMARHRLGDSSAARTDFDRAVRWIEAHPSLDQFDSDELEAFRDEAQAVLAGPTAEPTVQEHPAEDP
jgi:tetratricopeptide (TPR) repeat protein